MDDYERMDVNESLDSQGYRQLSIYASRKESTWVQRGVSFAKTMGPSITDYPRSMKLASPYSSKISSRAYWGVPISRNQVSEAKCFAFDT